MYVTIAVTQFGSILEARVVNYVQLMNLCLCRCRLTNIESSNGGRTCARRVVKKDRHTKEL